MIDRENMNLDYKPTYPNQSKLNIGIVGAGEIVKYCHLPAYSAAGFNVVAICDKDLSKANALASQFSIPHVYDCTESLILRDDIHIIDIATPSQALPFLVELACKYKKHVLVQKPLALDLSTANEIATMVAEAGIKGAVNHQMRYSPAINAARDVLTKGLIGELNYAAFNVNVHQPWETWKFWHDIEFFTIYGHTIHYFDTLRYLLDKTPNFIYTQIAKGQNRDKVPGHLRDYSFLSFGDELIAQVDVNHDNKCTMDDWQAGFRLEGSLGVINGTNGALHNYPHGKEDTIAIYTTPNNQWHKPILEGRWFPDAFMGTMGELMFAIENKREARNSIKDGIDTIKMVSACVQSIKENRPVFLAELED